MTSKTESQHETTESDAEQAVVHTLPGGPYRRPTRREKLQEAICRIIENRIPGDENSTAEEILEEISDLILSHPVEIPIEYFQGSKRRMSWATALSWSIWLSGKPPAEQWEALKDNDPDLQVG